MLKLNYDFTFEELRTSKGLNRLNNLFLKQLKTKDNNLYKFVKDQQKQHKNFKESYGNEGSELLETAQIIEDFLLDLFNIQNSYKEIINQLSATNKIFLFRKLFLNKYVKLIPKEEAEQYNFNDIKNKFFKILNITTFNQDVIATIILTWLNDTESNEENLKVAKIFSYHMLYSNVDLYHNQILYFKAKKTDFLNLFNTKQINNTYSSIDEPIIPTNFNHTNNLNNMDSINEANYCIKCHVRDKDSCKTGLKDTNLQKNDSQTNETNDYQKNPLGQSLKGCPISMHISQMHTLYENHNLIASLVVITINNPLLPILGHNICNACETSCIFQKQQPVNTPKVETTILQNILEMPEGFEIYYLLTQWNPLRFYNPLPKKRTGKNVLIVGSGPAGCSLSYGLYNQGHNVVMIDALKIQPLDTIINYNEPIVNITNHFKSLEQRTILGLGGVAEYGITSRWNKNYLLLIAIILYRQKNFKLYDNIHFSSSITTIDAIKLGFNHLCLSVGAGKPKVIDLPNSLASGITTSSEFLMSLHLGAYKLDNILSIPTQLPAIIIGGGLTAIDCASSYIINYFRQLEKFINQYNKIINIKTASYFDTILTTQDKALLNIYLNHYKEYEIAKQNNTLANLVKKLGGVKIIYHKKLTQSKAYINNYTEVKSALKLGVEFIEDMSTIKFNLDEDKKIKSITALNNKTNCLEELEAKSIIVATGTSANNIPIEEESIKDDTKHIYNKNTLLLQWIEYSKDNEKLFNTYKNKQYSPILSYTDDFYISYFGDMHPTFAGSVVGAVASAFFGIAPINHSLSFSQNTIKFSKLISSLNSLFTTKLIKLKHLKEDIIEITFKAPYISKNIKTGQFFKIQSYESNKILKNLSGLSKPVILGHFSNNPKTNTLKALMLKNGASTQLLSKISTLDKIAISGNFGKETPVIKNQNILIIGTSIASYSLIPALENFKSNNNKVITLLGYKKNNHSFYKNLFKKNSHKVLFAIEDLITSKHIKNDIIKGNIIDCIDYFKNNSILFPFTFDKIDKIIISASAPTTQIIKDYLIPHVLHHNMEIFASIPSPMMCTMKGVCGMCLQKKIINNKEVYVYSCKNNDLNLLEVDLNQTIDRLQYNSLFATISKLYMDLI
jgi:NADPH-dependent glutamate synthase beta subunit-like oxidoreductase/NAD(P)H-flavin reductase